MDSVAIVAVCLAVVALAVAPGGGGARAVRRAASLWRAMRPASSGRRKSAQLAESTANPPSDHRQNTATPGEGAGVRTRRPGGGAE